MMFVWLPWGLTTTQNSISLKAQDRIWIGSRLTDTRSAENDWIGADTDPQYRINASLVLGGYRHILTRPEGSHETNWILRDLVPRDLVPSLQSIYIYIYIRAVNINACDQSKNMKALIFL